MRAGNPRPHTEGFCALAEAPHTSQPESVITDWLVSQLSIRLGVAPSALDIRQPLVRYGLDSVMAVEVVADLEEWLGGTLSATLAWDYPSIAEIARYLAGEVQPTAAEPQCLAMEAVAIIGIGCRFPGAKSPGAFWQLLHDGVDAITEVPSERWDLRAFYHPDPAVPGKMNTRWGGFLEQVEQFDPHFFGISPREAARMDPQQRLLLEVAWEALEDAGQVATDLARTPTGVFIGISSSDYAQLQLSDPNLGDAYAGTGSALSITANRLSYLLNLRGPSMAVDTACSSSLVALHLACQSLWQGESTLALAGGVNLILLPALTVNFTKAGFMASDGRCKAFDARANGYVRGEGAGVVVLKPLSYALAEGDPIYAVIRGSAVNQDGRTNGLTAPSRQAQEDVLRAAYQRAGVSPGQVQYVEAHGTGTALGDPIEAQALGTVLAVDRPPGRKCALGSAKTNIGHLEAAAGIAGLIKVALSLKHRALPPSLHFHTPNAHIPFDDLPIRVQQRLGPWPPDDGPALAGVSAFGFGGTNAHVVLEEAPRIATGYQDDEPPDGRPHLLPLSARSPEALQSLARAYRDFLDTTGPGANMALRDICYTASMRRSHHDYRLTCVAHSREEARERLDAFLRQEASAGLSVGHYLPGRGAQLVGVFSGQGPQWWGMGRELLEQEPVFRTTLEQCEALFRQHASWSLLEELTAAAPQSRLQETAIAQPALFALQVALAALWRSWGIKPNAVVGHSVGEVAAAHVAGALSLRDAVRIIFHRGRLMQRASGQGKMAAVELSPQAAIRALSGYEEHLSIAAINGPTSTVLSGNPTALTEVLASLQQQKVFCRVLPVHYAFHSPHMEPFRHELVQALQDLEPRPAVCPIYSTVTGRAGNGEDFTAAYWGRNVREPVLFAAAITRAAAEGHNVFLEFSPHPVLAGAITQCLHHCDHEGTVLPSLRRGAEERAVLLESLGALYALGRPVNWSGLYASKGQCVRLPSYPWQRQRCWLETTEAPTSSPWEQPYRDRGAQGLEAAKQAEHPSGAGSLSRDALLTAEPEERQQLLASYLRTQVATGLRLPVQKLDMQQPLINLGLDSLLAVELKNRVEADLGIVVPVVHFLQGFSIAQFTVQLLEQLLATPPPVVVAKQSRSAPQDPPAETRSRAERAAQTLAKLEQLSEQEVDALLSDMFAASGE